MNGSAYTVEAPGIMVLSACEADGVLTTLAEAIPAPTKPEACKVADLPPKGCMGEAIGTTTSLEGLTSILTERRRELGLSQLLVDDIAGLPSGYTAKVECRIKGLGKLSLPCLLGALGLELAVVRTVPHAEKQGRI